MRHMPQSLQTAMHIHFDVGLFAALLVKVTVSWLLTFPISVERARDDRSAGLRTFPIVAAASCGYVLLAGQVIGLNSDLHAHILQGLVTGIGFIGGGAIVKEPNRVRGTATAAAIWSTGIIGAAVGYGQFEIAAVIGAFTASLLWIVSRYEMRRDAREATVMISEPIAPPPSALPDTSEP
jgi:putative Mg2+ transporter-C (MgtC) family protein